MAPDDRSVVDARRLLGSSRSTVAFTGAGVSTAHVLRGAVEEILPAMVAA